MLLYCYFQLCSPLSSMLLLINGFYESQLTCVSSYIYFTAYAQDRRDCYRTHELTAGTRNGWTGHFREFFPPWQPPGIVHSWSQGIRLLCGHCSCSVHQYISKTMLNYWGEEKTMPGGKGLPLEERPQQGGED